MAHSGMGQNTLNPAAEGSMISTDPQGYIPDILINLDDCLAELHRHSENLQSIADKFIGVAPPSDPKSETCPEEPGLIGALREKERQFRAALTYLDTIVIRLNQLA